MAGAVGMNEDWGIQADARLFTKKNWTTKSKKVHQKVAIEIRSQKRRNRMTFRSHSSPGRIRRWHSRTFRLETIGIMLTCRTQAAFLSAKQLTSLEPKIKITRQQQAGASPYNANSSELATLKPSNSLRASRRAAHKRRRTRHSRHSSSDWFINNANWFFPSFN